MGDAERFKEAMLGKKEKQPEPPQRPPATPKEKLKPIYRIPKATPKVRFDRLEYADLYTALDQYLRTYNNPKRQDKIKPGGVVDNRNKRIILLKEKLKKILNY